ncbi:MAG: transcriptional regulatory protein WalR [Armatimonadota bacterium]|nr:MAG: transcriptional regulatory protein WalR [Armatimonadota bacterium]
MATKVLVVDDERTITDGLTFNLKKEGFEVVPAYNGEDAISLFEEHKPDIVILDIMLPGLDGFTVCRILRKQSSVPIIMLTARAEKSERLLGFEAGADDYVVKPFFTDEIAARIRAILRRGREVQHGEGAITVEGITIDPARRVVEKDSRQIEMSRKEFDLLYELARTRGRVHSRQSLLSKVWGEDSYIDPHTVDVHICRLRDKLEDDPRKPSLILTVRGVGYKMAEPA